MSMVRFAAICDRCGKRSEEYCQWWTCTDCMDDVCDDCILPCSEDEETGRALCKACAVEPA